MSGAPSTMTEMRTDTRLLREAAPLPRLLAGVHPHGAVSLAEHVALHGPLPEARRGRRHSREDASALIDEIERSGLLGRGGAAFPTATKMRAVARSKGQAIVIANGAEGEPASLKDRTLLEMAPQLVLEGAVLAARAVNAEEAIVCVCETADASLESLELALSERAADPSCAGSARLRLTTVPGHYVAGQETALVNHLGGGPAKPTFTPPMPFEQGLKRRPTLINNVETLAHIALIARHGARWFRRLGRPTQPGSALITLSGPLTYPGVYEIEPGSSLTSLIDAAGGTTAGVRGALIGGYAGAWVGRGPPPPRPLQRAPRGPRRLTGGRHRPAAVGRSVSGGRNRACGALAGRTEHATVRTLRERTGRDRPEPRAAHRRQRRAAGDAADRAPGLAHSQARRLLPSRRRRQPDPERPGILPGRVRRPRSPRPLRGLRPRGRAAAALQAGQRRARTRDAGAPMSHRVRVNPIACEAHGMCVELLPERISFDDWGYPVVDETPLQGREVEHAMRAARACPTFALLVERDRARVK